jgi:hypothetical protein
VPATGENGHGASSSPSRLGGAHRVRREGSPLLPGRVTPRR